METSLDTLADLLTRPQFHAGLLAGLVAWIGFQILSASGRGWGLAVSAATIIGVNLSDNRRLSTTAGLVLLALGGALLERARSDSGQSPLPWVLIGLGAVVTTLRGGLPVALWVQFAAPVLIVFVGYWMSGWSVLPQRRLVGPLMAITAFGVWATVPDTDSARVLLGAALPLAVATLPKEGLNLSASGSFPLAGLLVWVAATGGEGRHASIVGAWACIALLLLAPLLMERARSLPGWLVAGGHALLVFISSRVFGLWETGASAAVGALVTTAAAFFLMWALAGDQQRSQTTSIGQRP